MKNYLKPISMTFMATVLCVSSAQAGLGDIFNPIKRITDKIRPGSNTPRNSIPQENPLDRSPVQAAKTLTQGPIQRHSPELSQAILKLLSAGSLNLDGKSIDVASLRSIYGARGNVSVWTMSNGFTPLGWKIQEILPAQASWHGLTIGKYLDESLVQRIETIAMGEASTQSLAEIEILITQSYWSFLKDTSTGQINPKDPSQNLADFELKKPAAPDFRVVAASMYSQENLENGIELMAPPFNGYKLLQNSLANLNDSENSRAWEDFRNFEAIKPGRENENIVKIRGRLAAFGYLGSEEHNNQSWVYDAKLLQAVVKFQEQHNLGADGIIGNGTYAILNKPFSSFKNQIIANMEKWRFYPRGKDRFIMVDMGRQELDVMDNGVNVFSRRTIVGGEMTGTPTMADRVTSIKLAPDWTSPDSIVVKENIPEMGNDPAAYLASKKIEVIPKSGGAALSDSQINAVNWRQYTMENRPPYLFRTKMGEFSALGLVKFNLTNGHSIYLHDTGTRAAFNNKNRYMSHGCIRVDQPFDLVAYLRPKFEDRYDISINPKGPNIPDWNISPVTPADWQNYAKNITLLPNGYSETLRVESTPVYIFGTTTVSYLDNTIAFGKDVYKQDERIISALKRINGSN